MLCMFIVTYHCPKDILGLGGGEHQNKRQDTILIFSMTNVTILSIFRTYTHGEYRKVLQIKSTSILNILAILLFEN